MKSPNLLYKRIKKTILWAIIILTLLIVVLIIILKINDSRPVQIENFAKVSVCDVVFHRPTGEAILEEERRLGKEATEKWGRSRPPYKEIPCENLNKLDKDQKIRLVISFEDEKIVKLLEENRNIEIDGVIIQTEENPYFVPEINQYEINEVGLDQSILNARDDELSFLWDVTETEQAILESDDFFELVAFRIILKNQNKSTFFDDKRFNILACYKDSTEEINNHRQKEVEISEQSTMAGIYYRILDSNSLFERWYDRISDVFECLIYGELSFQRKAREKKEKMRQEYLQKMSKNQNN